MGINTYDLKDMDALIGAEGNAALLQHAALLVCTASQARPNNFKQHQRPVARSHGLEEQKMLMNKHEG
jgi:hypothetical protein